MSRFANVAAHFKRMQERPKVKKLGSLGSVDFLNGSWCDASNNLFAPRAHF